MQSPEELQQIISRLAGILYQERLSQNLSQNEVATRAGLSRTMVMRVEKLERVPTIDTLLRICQALGIDLWKVIRQASGEL